MSKSAQPCRKRSLGLIFGLIAAFFHAPISVADDGIEVTDLLGKTVKLTKPVERIAVLIPSIADVISELGKQDLIVAAPEFSKLKNPKLINLGPYTQISAEAVFEQKPDLVLGNIDGNMPFLQEQLQRLGLKTLFIDTRSLSSLIKSLELISKVCGFKAKPEKLLELEKTLAALRSQKKNFRSKIFIQLGFQPLVTISKNTFIGEIIELLGYTNIYSQQAVGYPKISTEDVISNNPEQILIIPLVENDPDVLNAQNFWNKFQNLAAVKNHKIKILSKNDLIRPSFALTREIQLLQKVLKQ